MPSAPINPENDFVLLIGSGRSLFDLTAARLATAGYRTDRADTLAAAWRSVTEKHPFAVIVDAVDPQSPWHPFELCHEFAGDPSLLVILFIPEQLSHDRTKAFRCGADQCFASHPESIDELLAYLQARRVERRHAQALPPPSNGGVSPIEIDWENRQIRRGSRASDLSSKESLLLELLIQHKGHMVPHGAIHQHLWRKRNRASCAANVKQIIFRLRRKMEANPRRPKHLLTVRGLGYRIVLTPES